MVERIKRAWDDGDAVFPLDQRLPVEAKRRILEGASPTRIVTDTDETGLDGSPVNEGQAAIIATSGSTGDPKFVVLTLDALTASAMASHARLGVGGNDRWLCCLPPSHVGGFGVIARSILTRTPITAVARFSPEDYASAANNGATLVSLVPTALARVDPGLYRTVLLGGSAPPVHLPSNCVTTYGLTETGGGIVYDAVPLDGVEIEVRNDIIHVRSPMNARTLRDGTPLLDVAGWLRTGDIGSIDDKTGTLTVRGREGDLIITGGENVWPEQVERAISNHPWVAEACVVGEPDPEWGHIVVAHIVPEPGRTPTLADIRDHVKQQLPAHCAPKTIHLVESIPRTSLGKPRRHLLRGNGS